jgi:hypothetical protein
MTNPVIDALEKIKEYSHTYHVKWRYDCYGRYSMKHYEQDIQKVLQQVYDTAYAAGLSAANIEDYLNG